MRYFFWINGLIILLLVSPVLMAQGEYESVSYDLIFSKGSSHNLIQTAGQDGLLPEDFGRWLSNRVSVVKTMENIGRDLPVRSQLLFFVIDQRGAVLSQNSLTLQVNSSRDLLIRSLNVHEMSRTLDAVFINQRCRISGDVLLSGEQLFPGGFLIGSIYESQRLASNAASRVLRATPNQQHGYTLFMMVAPDIDEFEYSVDPGTAAFFCKSEE